VDKGELVLIASFPKSGGSWLVWMLMDLIHKPDYYCDLVDKKILDSYIHKTERPINHQQPNIHIFRHPLDVVCSAYNYALLTDRSVVEEHLFYDVYLNNGHLDNFGNNTTYRTQYEYGLQAPIQIKYEDLLSNTSAQLRKIVTTDQQTLDNTINKYSLENCRKRESEVKDKLSRNTNTNYTFFYKAQKYYYKEKMTQTQIEKGHAVFSDIIKEHWPDSL
jgi:hypothetical protein